MPEPKIDVAPYYNGGLSWKQFMASAKAASQMQEYYGAFDFDEDIISFFNGRTPLQVLAIAEDWCPDVVQSLSVAARLCDEVPGMELSIVKKSDAPELMNEYSSGGKERIPVVAFFDMTFRELGRWSGRCKAADQWIFGEVLKGTRDIASLGGADASSFDREFDKRFREKYVWDTINEWQHLLEDQDY
jgi:hypothetical protein